MSIKKTILLSVLSFILCFTSASYPVLASDSLVFIVLSSYSETIDIGESFYLMAITSDGKRVSFKSSDSKIASVNTYGKVIGKKNGTVTITAKTKNAETSCKVKVNKTIISLNIENASIEHNEVINLKAVTSNGAEVKWKSNKKSVAIVDQTGKVIGGKPGEAVITASCDGTSASCKIMIKKPSIKLNQTMASLYRKETLQLTASVSSNIKPVWKSNKKSVAIVDENGKVTAVKNGTAVISATVDGVSKTCEITIVKPTILLNTSELTLTAGKSAVLTARVSSGNLPVWSSSNSNVASVDSNGTVTTYQKGTATIYAAEDGTKARCSIKVIEPVNK